MIKWIIYLPFSLLISVICYITNPIVLLFCNDDGELKGFLHLWQTWDNATNPSDIKDIAPKWLLYDWDKHYKERIGITNYTKNISRERWFTDCIDNNWTSIEKFKRYICRIIWLTRNNAYGWGFYVFGNTVSSPFNINKSENTKFVSEINGDGWYYKNDAPIFKIFGYTVKWNNFLGWKINTNATYDTRAMIANRISFKFKKY